jgi:hypothetical protein
MKSGKRIVKVDGRIVGKRKAKGVFRTIRLGDRTITKRVIEADKGDFATQFTYAFRNSVKRAREENREAEKEG